MLGVKEKIKTVLVKLKERIDNNEFGMVGVDGSGRVPALLLSQAIKYHIDIETRFIAGSRWVNGDEHKQRIDELVDYFSNPLFQNGLSGRKIIVCDDVIATGESIELICKALQKSQIPYEVVSLSMQRGLYSEDELKNIAGSSIVYADNNVPVSYNKPQMAGVKKSSEIFSEPLDKYIVPSNNIPGEINNNDLKQKPEILQRTRKLIKQHAAELADELGWIES